MSPGNAGRPWPIPRFAAAAGWHRHSNNLELIAAQALWVDAASLAIFTNKADAGAGLDYTINTPRSGVGPSESCPTVSSAARMASSP